MSKRIPTPLTDAFELAQHLKYGPDRTEYPQEMDAVAFARELEIMLEAAPVPAREYEGPQWQFWQEGDRFYHARDKTWWRFDPKLNRLVRAEAP